MAFRIDGIDLTIGKPPRQSVSQDISCARIALLGEDYRDLRPRFAVEAGAIVQAGDLLFTDRRRPHLRYVAPASGKVAEIRLGGRRALETLVIDVDGQRGCAFNVPEQLSRENLTELLLESGQWQGLKTRPFDDVPVPGSVPDAIFVTAIDTRPLAADPIAIITHYMEFFRKGLSVLRLLSDGKMWLCCAAGTVEAAMPKVEGVETAAFSGPHPAGLAGTHIHKLNPVGQGRTVWHIGYQDVIAIGHLLATGMIWTRRVVALAGQGVSEPELLETMPGCELSELCKGRVIDGPVRLLSGSLLDGRAQPYLSRWHLQVSAQPRHAQKQMFSTGIIERARRWLSIGGDAIIPNAVHERAAPAGVLAIPFLRAISVGDVEAARKLGALELAEEDMALLNHVDGGRTDFARLLRRTLDELREA